MKPNCVLVNGTAYDSRTPAIVARELERARINRYRVRVWYGDTLTGAAWDEENDVSGYIGRSTGENKVPLLIPNSRSFGGGHILDRCIVRVDRTETRETMYAHPSFSAGNWQAHNIPRFTHNGREYGAEALKNGVMVARFSTFQQAERYTQFMRGERYSK